MNLMLPPGIKLKIYIIRLESRRSNHYAEIPYFNWNKQSMTFKKPNCTLGYFFTNVEFQNKMHHSSIFKVNLANFSVLRLILSKNKFYQSWYAVIYLIIWFSIHSVAWWEIFNHVIFFYLVVRFWWNRAVSYKLLP